MTHASTPAEDIHLFSAPRPLNSLATEFIALYHRKRYLRRLTDAELGVRLCDVVSNLMVLGDDRKYRPQLNVRENGIHAPIRGLDFARMAADVWEELRLRGLRQGSYDQRGPAIATRLVDESWCWRPQWQEVSRQSLDRYEHPRMLFRFSGNIDWNRSFLANGRFYVQPASIYNDSALDNARRDDELSTSWFDETLSCHSYTAPNYYCMCFSATYDYRLFHDFGAVSCVAIHEPAELGRRIFRAIDRHNAGSADRRIARLYCAPVLYSDPFQLMEPTDDMEVHFVKHFRFAYQAEYRFVLVPAGYCPLQPFFLDIGSLADIAAIVERP